MKQTTSLWAAHKSALLLYLACLPCLSVAQETLVPKLNIGFVELQQNQSLQTAPWIITFTCLILIGIILVTLWPNEGENNQTKRQRKFARMDGLYFQVQGHVCGPEESRNWQNHSKSKQGPRSLPLGHMSESFTLVSLSYGGCSMITDSDIAKGEIVYLQLHTLPDFPEKNLTVALKTVWIKSSSEPKSKIFGGKIVHFYSDSSADSLRKYLNFLMDEPVT